MFPHHVSTSYAERQNLTLRMSQRRFTRLTNAFSKLENYALSVALHYMHYNFCRIHRTLRVAPAMAAGVTDRLLEIADMCGSRMNTRPAGRRRWPSNYRTVGICVTTAPRRQIMKLALIAIGLLATTGVVYAACVFC